jgi:formylglycine-generating enzyme required for sulfatase activity
MINKEQRRILGQLRDSQDVPFSEMVRMAGLDPATDFVGATLRNVNFRTSDLAGYSFARADLTGADMTKAKGKERLVLTGAITRDAEGLPDHAMRPSDPALQVGETRDAPHLPTLVRIPAGTFLMGTPAVENKREGMKKEWAAWSTPQRRMTIPNPFLLGKTLVTRGQFARFVAEKGYKTEPKARTFEPDAYGKWRHELGENRDWQNPGFEQTDDHPVVCVNHDDAVAYIEWLRDTTKKDYRLPSEAEWEYAARAGTTTARFWGDDRVQAVRYAKVADAALMRVMGRDFNPEQFFEGDSGYPFTAPVGGFLPNPFGLYDMLGNVWEWMADYWTDKLPGLLQDGRPNTTGDSELRALRGGAWSDDPWVVHAGHRSGSGTGNRNIHTGFRVARTL